MANDQNLIPNNKRSPREVRENGRKGGIASVKSRREKATFKKAFQAILEMQVPIPDLQAALERLCINPTTRNAAVYTAILTAISKGDIDAIVKMMRILDEDKTVTDRREQNARIKRMKAETDKIEKEVAIKTGEAGADMALEQQAAIANMINTPDAERVLQDFLGPAEEVGNASEANNNPSGDGTKT